MESCRRLIQDVDRLSRGASRKLRCKLDPLCFSPGQLCGRLAQFNIGKSHVIQRLDLTPDGRNILKEGKRLFHSHIQHIIDVLSFIIYIQCFPVVSFATANLARYINIRQEIHLDLQDPVTGTGLTAPAFDVKRKSSLLVASCLSKKRTDHIKHARRGSRIRTRGAADRRLVDGDDLVQLLLSIDPVVITRNAPGSVQIPHQMLIQDLIDQRTLSGAGYSGHTSHDAKRDLHINVFQVILPCTADGQFSRALSSFFRNRDFQFSA